MTEEKRTRPEGGTDYEEKLERKRRQEAEEPGGASPEPGEPGPESEPPDEAEGGRGAGRLHDVQPDPEDQRGERPGTRRP